MINQRYINLFTDFGFKRIFGQEGNKELLIDFLNQVLPTEYFIKELNYSKNEHVGFSKEDRKAIFDLHCISKKGERFVVELQNAKQEFFKDRALYYSTFPIVNQAKQGDWNFKLGPVFLVAILNFKIDDSPKIRSHVQLKDQDCIVFYDKFHMLFLEVAKFKKTLQECESRFEKWLWIFKNLPELDEVPQELLGDMIGKVFKIAEVAQMKPQEKEAYLSSLKQYWDLNNVLDTAFNDGIKEGIKEGAEKEKLKTACKMIQDGLSTELIIKYTGLSADEIEDLDCATLDN